MILSQFNPLLILLDYFPGWFLSLRPLFKSFSYNCFLFPTPTLHIQTYFIWLTYHKMVHSLLLTWDRATPSAIPAIVYKFLSAHDLTISIQPLVHTFLPASATYKITTKLISALYYSIIHEIIYCKTTLQSLTLYLPMWRIWWVTNKASKGQMGFNSTFKGLKKEDKFLTFSYKWLISLTSKSWDKRRQCLEDTLSSGVPSAVARQTPADGTLLSTDPGGVEGVVRQRSAHSELSTI